MNEKEVCAIILAAGESSRMGETKQLLPLGNNTILECVIESTLEASFPVIYIVIGYQADKICNQTNIKNNRLHWLINDDYENGQSTSIQQAFQQFKNEYSKAMIFLGDMPFLSSKTINDIYKKGMQIAQKEQNSFMVRPTYHNTIGHPVFIGNITNNIIKNMQGDTGLKKIIKQQHFIKVNDSGAIFDIDTRTQYKNALKKDIHH